MIYIRPLSEYIESLKSRKWEGLVRLSKLRIPSVENTFLIQPFVFKEFNKTGDMPEEAWGEIRKVFESIKLLGKTVTLRNAVYEQGNPAVAYAISNTLNIKDFSIFSKRLLLGYKKIQRIAINPENVEFTYLLQAFYSSEKCGKVYINIKDEIYLQAIWGQHTKLILFKEISPDEYWVAKNTYKIIKRKISTKKFRIKRQTCGIKKARVKMEDQKKAVLNDEQAVKIAKLAMKVERANGPQEIDWAILDSGEIIFQETREI